MDHPARLLRTHLQVSVGGLHQHRLPQPQQQEEEGDNWRHPAEGNPPSSGKRLGYQQLTVNTITASPSDQTGTVPDTLEFY